MDATLQAEKRDGRGKNEARRLRASGRIPAVVYGAEKGKAVEIAVDPKILMRILHSESGVNTLIGLKVEEPAATEPVVGAVAAPAEPEVIKKGKTDKDEEK